MFFRLLLAGILATSLASAQRGGGGGRGGSSGPIMPMGSTPDKLGILTDTFKLTKDQKADAQTVMVDAMKESAPLRQQMAQSRAAIANAILGGKTADDQKKALDAYTALVAQVTGIETKAFAKVCATLKPNQQGKAGVAFESMAGIFNAPAGGGGRRGRN